MDLQEFFGIHPHSAIGFSGGVDSAYLLYAAKKYAERVCAYYVKSVFQPRFEMEDALRLAKELDVPVKVLEVDVLNVPRVKDNPPERCYYCKQAIFGTIKKAAEADGFSLLLDGTNASDEVSDRPGMKALGELSVRSPLRECALTKGKIRELSKEAGLFTWDKPAYACLASRFVYGEEITEEKLLMVDRAEQYLIEHGFLEERVRMHGNMARIEVPARDIARLAEESIRIPLWERFREIGFSFVTLDLKGYRQGSMNETLEKEGKP